MSDVFDTLKVVLMERHPIRSGRQVLKLVTTRKPTYAGIDPYNFYIDRSSADNVLPVTEVPADVPASASLQRASRIVVWHLGRLGSTGFIFCIYSGGGAASPAGKQLPGVGLNGASGW